MLCRSLVPLLFVLSTGVLAAQTDIVLPSVALERAPRNSFAESPVSDLLYGSPGANVARTQVLFDVTDIGLTGGVLRSLQLRPPFGFSTNAATTMQLSIQLSWSPVSPQGASATFAANRGPAPTTVFSGSLTLPTSSPGTWPNVWQQPIQFQTPFLVAPPAAGSLCVEITTTGSTSSESWFVEGYERFAGMAEDDFVTAEGRCLDSQGFTVGGYEWGGVLLPGNLWTFAYASWPNLVPSLNLNLCLFGFQGVGGHFLGAPLPRPLVGLGLPSQPSCLLALVPDSSVVMLVQDPGVPGHGTTLRLPATLVPASPQLAGLVFYTQALAMDVLQGQFSVYATRSIRWTVGSGETIPAATVFTRDDITSPTGAVRQGSAPAMRFHR